MKREVAADLRAVFNAATRHHAETLLTHTVQKYASRAAKLADWLETNIPEGLTVFAFPEAHRRLLRTSNSLERLNREIRRRSRVATLFPNEASCLRLVTAVLMEISEEWQTDRAYLRLDNL
jgi:transposase-like protein